MIHLTQEQHRLLCLIKILDTGCWEWQGKVDNREPLKDYGWVKVGGRNGKLHRAHRYVYEKFVGPIPEGLDLGHQCHYARCVNPGHLEPITNYQNQQDRKNSGRNRTTYTPEGNFTGAALHRMRHLWLGGVPKKEIAKRFAITTQALEKLVADQL